MRITFCGTGSGGASAARSASCILLDDGEKGMLLDCGPGTIRALFRARLALPKAQVLLVSHLHMDHVLGFGEWLAHLVFPYQVVPRVYGPSGTAAFVDLVGQSTGMTTSILGQQFGVPLSVPVIELEDGARLDLPECRSRSIVVPHAPEVVALAHRVEFGGRIVAYSGDTQAVPELMVPLTDGGDILIHEAYSDAGLADWTHGIQQGRAEAIAAAFTRSHTRVDVAARIASEAGAKQLVLTHLCPGEKPDRLKAEASAYFNGEIVVAEDELVLEL